MPTATYTEQGAARLLAAAERVVELAREGRPRLGEAIDHLSDVAKAVRAGEASGCFVAFASAAEAEAAEDVLTTAAEFEAGADSPHELIALVDALQARACAFGRARRAARRDPRRDHKP